MVTEDVVESIVVVRMDVKLKIRAHPSVRSKEIGTVSPGQRVRLLVSTDDWVKVECGTLTGWMATLQGRVMFAQASASVGNFEQMLNAERRAHHDALTLLAEKNRRVETLERQMRNLLRILGALPALLSTYINNKVDAATREAQNILKALEEV